MLLAVPEAAPAKEGAAVTRAGPPAGLHAEPFLVPDPGTHTATIRRMDADAAGRFLVTGSDDKSVRVWSREGGRRVRTIRVPAGPGHLGKVFAVALSPDGGTIAAGGFTDPRSPQHIYLFDRASGHQVGLIGGLPSVARHLAFSPDGTRLAAALAGANGVRLFDTGAWRQVAADTDYDGDSYGLAFASDGRVATTSYDGKVRLYGPDLRRLRVDTAPGGKRPHGIAFAPDGRSLAVGYTDTCTVDVLDAGSLTRLRAADTAGIDNGNLGNVAWSPDGRLFAAGRWQRGSDCFVRAWADGGRRVLRDDKGAGNAIMSLRPLSDGALALAAGDPRLALLDANGAPLWVIGPQTADYRNQRRSLAVSGEGAQVRFGFEQGGARSARFDLRARQLALDPPPDPALRPPRTEGLPVVWQNTVSPTLAGKPLAIEQYEMSRSLAVAPDARSFVLGCEWSLRRFTADGSQLWRVDVPEVVWAVAATADGRAVVAAYDDGTVRWHRLSDGAEVLAFFPHPDGRRWVAWTPLGHYAAAPGGEELVHWQLNRGQEQAPELFGAARFRDRFYRPDVVTRVLDTLDPARALAGADRATGRATPAKSPAAVLAADAPPRVAILDPAEGAFVAGAELPVAYLVEDRPGTALRRVRLLVDGRVAATQDGLSVPEDGRLYGEARVPLQGDGRLLTLLAESDKGSSDPASVQIRRPAMAGSAKPDLYVLAVGVSRFRNAPALNLKYAGRDAAAFAARMCAQEGGLYRRVRVRPLVDDEATVDAIRDGLEWLEREMTARDVAAVFVSTHGQNGANRRLYLLPHDVDIRDEIRLRRTGLPAPDLTEALARLAERGKTLVFLDACHAGNLLGGKAGPPDIDRVASELASAENGVVMFTSCTGTQLSVERDDLAHGVFTHALLGALESPEAGREPPWLYVSDLDIWLRDKVKALTSGAQTPQTIVPEQRFTNPRIFMVPSAPG